MEATCTHWQWDDVSQDNTPVHLTCVENRLVITYAGSQAKAGLFLSEPLSQELRKYSVTLTASLGPPKPLSTVSVSSGCTLHVRPLKIVTYGLLSEGDAVANILGDARLFLQRPEISEYDLGVRYINPMYFLRPGQEMPTVVDGPIAGSDQGQSTKSVSEGWLDEVEKDRIFKIFDEAIAQDISVVRDVKQSPRIVSVLKE